jgi:hypothetical protein
VNLSTDGAPSLGVWKSVLVGGAMLVALAGCGSAESGPQRYHVSGNVTYDGKPVPKGFITFSPDTSKGNEGPGSGAPIENGTYDTSGGKGTVGGPHRVRIVGYDGVPTTEQGEELPDGKPLFPPYETTVDLPKEQNHRHDFEIPASRR